MSNPISYSMAGAVAASGRSKSYLERAIASGHLRAKKSSVDADGNPVGAFVIFHDDLVSFLRGLVDA